MSTNPSRLHESLWEIAKRISAACTVAHYAPVIIGSVGGIVVAVWSYFEQIPPPAIATLAVFVFAALIWAWNGVTQTRNLTASATPPTIPVPVAFGSVAAPGREFFVGQWSVEKGNGYQGAYVVELHDGGRAQKISGGMVQNVSGTWEYVTAGWVINGHVEVKWDDGDVDMLRVVKIGRRSDGSTFEAKAIKIKGAESLAPI